MAYKTLIILLAPALTCGAIAYGLLILMFRQKSHSSENNAAFSTNVLEMGNDGIYQAGQLFTEHLARSGFLPALLSRESSMEKIKPFIEKEIDHFIDEKLPVIFPLLSKFMGDKTKLQFKQAFMDETERLFPEVIKRYAEGIFQSDDTKIQLAGFIQTVPRSDWNRLIFPILRKKRTPIVLAACLMGFISGCFILLIQYIF